MPHKQTRIGVTRRLPKEIELRMSELFDVTYHEADTALDAPELAAMMADIDVLVPTVTDRLDRQLIEQAGPRLKLIANFGNGTDNIDIDAAHERGIIVSNTPSVLTGDTADMAMALILALPRRLVEGDRIMHQEGAFTGWSPNWMLGRRLAGKTLGIVGMGRIGQAIARRAAAFDIKVVYHNRNRLHPDIEAQCGASYFDNLDRMLREVDIVSLNCPHTPATYHLLSARRLALLQPHAIVVNTSRGEVIDEDALADRLTSGDIGGAALDVFEREPAINPRLRAFDNVILLPHMSSATMEGRQSMGEKVIINIQSWADGHRPPDRVLPSAALD
jgi:glyoxylate reductase